MSSSRAILAASVLAAVVGCQDTTSLRRATPHPDFIVVPLWTDTVGICLGAGSPTNSYKFSYTVRNQQPDDINQAPSPAYGFLSPGECLLPWRRLTPLPASVAETVIVSEDSIGTGVVFDSVELQDRNAPRTSPFPIDTVIINADSGGALTYYHHAAGGGGGGILPPNPPPFDMKPVGGPDPSIAFGRVKVKLPPTPPSSPPDPCGPIPPFGSSSAVALCGEIHNPGGETFTEGVLTVGGVDIPFAASAFPPNPCRHYIVQGTFPVPGDLLAGATSLSLRFDSHEHPDGAIGGSTGGGPGTPGTHKTDPGPPNTGGGACKVRFGP